MLDILPQKKREDFLNNIDSTKRESFKEFIVGKGTSVLKDESLLKTEAIKMIKLIKVASLSPDELYQIVISDMIVSLSTQDLSTLVKACSSEQKAYICEKLDSRVLASLVQNESLEPTDIHLEAPQFTKSEIIDLLIKASSMQGFEDSHIKKEKLEMVYAQVETDKAEVLADAMGLPMHLRFENLFNSYQDEALSYLKEMDYEQLSLLYPLLTKPMRQAVLKELPELLAERLAFAKKKINSESLKLKGDFYFFLRAYAVEEISKPSMRLVA